MLSGVGAAAALVIAYLLGSFPTASLVGGARGRDPAREGSGNPGATNVYRLAGARAGAAVLLGDLAKGALAAGAGQLIAGRALGVAAGVAAVVGHCFPLWRRGVGGKGVATAAGMALVLFPVAFVTGLAAWVIVAAVTRMASVASLLAAAAIPVAVAVDGHPATEVAAVVGVAVLIVVRHKDNLSRLVRGEERRLGSTRTARQ